MLSTLSWDFLRISIKGLLIASYDTETLRELQWWYSLTGLQSKGWKKCCQNLKGHKMLKMCHLIEPVEATATPELSSSTEGTDKKCSYLSPPALWSSVSVSHWLSAKRKQKVKDPGSPSWGTGQGRAAYRIDLGLKLHFPFYGHFWLYDFMFMFILLLFCVLPFTCQAHV